MRQFADYRFQVTPASSAVRVVDFKTPVGIDVYSAPFFFLICLAGGNEGGVGGDQKFDRVESTTETRAARCSFLSPATP